MRTKKSWMLAGSEKAQLGPFFSQLWRLMISYGHPPEAGGPDDDLFWECLVNAVGEIGDKSDVEHNPPAATLLLAALEALERLQAESGAPERSA